MALPDIEDTPAERPSEVRTQLAKGTLWISAARQTANLLGVATTLLLARILTPADFGVVAFGTTILSVINAVTNMSLSSALIQHRSPSPAHFHTAWTLNVGRGLLIAALMVAAAEPAAIIAREPRLAGLLCALALAPVFDGLQNPRLVMLLRRLEFRQQFAIQVGGKLVTILTSISLALAYKTYWALVAGTLAGQAASAVISYTLFPFRPRLSVAHYKELFSFSVWLTLGELVLTLNMKLDSLLIGRFLGRAPLGAFTLGDNLSVLPTREALNPVMSTVFPALAQFVHDPDRLARVYQRAQTLVTTVALPAGIGLALVADPLIRLTVGDKWLAAVPVVQIMSVAYSILTLSTLSQSLAMAAGATRLVFKRDLQGLFVAAPTVAIGLFSDGLMGVLYARIFLAVVGILLNMQVVKQVAGLSLFDQFAANKRALISVAVMALVVVSASAGAAPGHGAIDLMAAIALRAAIGAATYALVTAALWRLQGRPAGPETELLHFASRLVAGLRRKSGRAASW
jgi:O-antigen/teichoic acid export membrane protein